MGLRWLITGGCGFIGTSLVRDLCEEGGHSIRVIDNLSVGTREDLANVSRYTALERTQVKARGWCLDIPQLVVGDILDAELALELARDADVIVHLAANTGVASSVQDPRGDCVLNVLGTLTYLEAARERQVKRFIFASSGAPAGEVEPPIHEEIAPHPVSPYGASKLAGEGYCSAYYRTYGVDTVVLRFGNVYGPGSTHKSSVVAKFIKNALTGAPLEIYGDGSQTRDFIFIGDLVDALLRSASVADVGGEIFQIATSMETTVNDLVGELVAALDAHGVHDVQVINAKVRKGDVRRNYSDTSKAGERLGWRAVTSLRAGLSATVAYFVTAAGHGTSWD